MYYMLQQTFHINAKHNHTPDIRHHCPREDLTNVFNRTRGNEPGGCFFCDVTRAQLWTLQNLAEIIEIVKQPKVSIIPTRAFCLLATLSFSHYLTNPASLGLRSKRKDKQKTRPEHKRRHKSRFPVWFARCFRRTWPLARRAFSTDLQAMSF